MTGLESHQATLHVLGAPMLMRPGLTLALRPERRWQFLAVLAHGADWMSREVLADLLWPGLSSERARANLRKVIHSLREWREALALEEQGSLLRCTVQTDVRAFDEAISQGDLERAVSLWRGTPWSGLEIGAGPGIEEWIRCARQQLRDRWRTALLLLCERGDASAQLRWAGQLLDYDPLDEHAVRVKLSALSHAGQAHVRDAGVYEVFAQELESRTGLQPPETIRTFLLRDRPLATNQADDPSPGFPKADEIPSGWATGYFVGRQAELQHLGTLLARPECRWITLHGPGGVGKSRLLARTLEVHGGHYRHGVVAVALEDLSRPEEVGVLLARSLRLTLEPNADPLERVARFLRPRQMLLGVDNLETLPAAIPALTALLHDCRDLKMVVSSRERADVQGEWIMELDGLPYPEPDDEGRLEQFDAVQLFAHCARLGKPEFDLAAERTAVAALCRYVQGLPLALELAATWARYVSVAEIATDIAQGGDMLAEEDLRRMPRQRSLAAAFDYSWQRLVDAERRALMRLSVFRGGFSREAAQRVAEASLSVLAALIDKSLVQIEERSRRGSGAARFSLHPLVHQMAAARLENLPALRDAAQRDHADHFCRQLGRHPAGGNASHADDSAALMGEAQNAETAWRRACDQGRLDLLELALFGYADLFIRQQRPKDGAQSLRDSEPVLARDPLLLARARAYRTALETLCERHADAVETGRLALPILTNSPFVQSTIICEHFLGTALWLCGVPAEGERFLRQAADRARQHGAGQEEAEARTELSALLCSSGRFEDAAEEIELAISLARANGEFALQALVMGAQCQRLAGRPLEAIRRLEDIQNRCPPEARAAMKRRVPARLAQAWFDAGNLERAEACARDGLQYLDPGSDEDLRRAGSLVDLRCLLARIMARKGLVDEAQRILSETAGSFRDAPWDVRKLEIATHWAELLPELDRPDESRAVLDVALSHPLLPAEMREIAERILAGVCESPRPPSEHSRGVAAARLAEVIRLLADECSGTDALP
jgi:predicted ATPase/DNA-binding SARP family transcriptional activator